ncbi:MAG: ABC transporter substrate-binding protein [Candidatus Latescibacteria bacterium]|nr:ABC transporter substrate-binding protein [Candidatus Latescibacterota bacterium]
MRRMISSKKIALSYLLPFIVAVVGFAQPGQAQNPEHLIKLATLAPDGSSWLAAVRTIDTQVRAQTDGAVGFKVYPGGVQGDEDVMLRKMRIGQLHAGGFGGQGTSHAFADILALEMPFLFQNYDEVDYVLAQMDGFFSAGYQANGYVLLGWSDIGFVHLLSKAPVQGVSDIQKRKVWRLEGEPITQVLFGKAGVTSVPLAIPDVLLGLQTNLVDVVYASPVAAIVLQWFTRVKYVTELPINYSLGAFLIDKRVFDKLDPAHQTILHDTARKVMRQQMEQSRKDNLEAIEVMRANGLEFVAPDPDELATFKQLVRESTPELVGNAFSTQAYEQIQQHLATFRANDQP